MKTVDTRCRLRLARMVALALLATAGSVNAASQPDIHIEQGDYQRWNKAGMDTLFPEDAPLVEVFATGNGVSYSHIADTHAMRHALVKVGGHCSNRGTFKYLKAAVESGPEQKTSGGSLKEKTWKLEFPYADLSHINAAQLCNDHAKTLQQRSGLTLEKVVQNGFAMKVPLAISAQANAYCEAAGLGRGGLDSDTARLDVWVHCAANPSARQPRQRTATSGPDKPAGGEANRIFKSASFRLEQSNYRGQCPVNLLSRGSISASGAGTLEYRWISSDGRKGPKKSLKFQSAGSKSFAWKLPVEQPGQSGKQLGTAADPNQLVGWISLEVIYRVGNGQSFTRKTWTAPPQNYRVTCQPPRQPSMQLKPVTAKPLSPTVLKKPQ